MLSLLRSNRWLLSGLAIASFATVVAATFYRTSRCYHVPVPKETINFGLCDFHNAVYFPGKAYANRENPYLSRYAQRYPVNREMSPYSPLLLPFAALFGVLPLRLSEILWCALNTGLMLWLADWVRHAAGLRRSLATVFGIGAALVATRAGHSNLILGQFAALMAIACCYALHDATARPWRSALAVAVACIKPTFGLPLIVLMVCQRRFRVVALAIAISLVGGVASFAWIDASEGGLQQSLVSSQDAIVVDEDVDPTSAWMRTDWMSIVNRFAGVTPSAVGELAAMMLLLSPVGAVMWFRAAPKQLMGDDHDGDQATNWPDTDDMLVLSVIPLAIYHLAYDCLILTPVIGALIAGRPKYVRLNFMLRWGLVLLLVAPTMNYLATWSIMERLGIYGTARDLVIAITPLSLLVATVLLLKIRWSQSGSPLERTEN